MPTAKQLFETVEEREECSLFLSIPSLSLTVASSLAHTLNVL